MKTTYIVSGYMRSGTSMMMHALSCGGLNAAYDKRRDEYMDKRVNDIHYKLNNYGLYELQKSDVANINFPRQFEGRLIKVLFGGLYKMVPGKYKIVFMRRNYEEIRQSQEAGLGTLLQLDEQQFHQLLDNCVGIMNERRDCEIIQLNYRDVVDDPVTQFKYLADHGWPIDIEKAACVVDPELCRFRLENLEVGL